MMRSDDSKKIAASILKDAVETFTLMLSPQLMAWVDTMKNLRNRELSVEGMWFAVLVLERIIRVRVSEMADHEAQVKMIRLARDVGDQLVKDAKQGSRPTTEEVNQAVKDVMDRVNMPAGEA